MCACANPDCVEMTELSVAEYESDPKLAHSLPGQAGARVLGVRAGPVDPRTLELQAFRRRIAEEWPEGRSKELVLRVLDNMVLEADEGQRS